MSDRHYVYVHRKATDGVIFYVGKGKHRRAWSKIGRNQSWRKASAEHGLTVSILQGNMSEVCALTLERIVIARIGMANLTNMKSGGRGNSGWKQSAETRARIGAHFKGREFTPKMRAALEAYNRNKKLTDEHKEKLSAAKKGKVRGPLSASTRAKIARSHLGIKPSEASRQKMRASKIGKAVGRDNPTYDHTVRTFQHAQHGMFVGTRGDFIAAFNLADGCVSAVINRRQKSVKGWRLS